MHTHMHIHMHTHAHTYAQGTTWTPRLFDRTNPDDITAWRFKLSNSTLYDASKPGVYVCVYVHVCVCARARVIQAKKFLGCQGIWCGRGG